MIDKCPFAGMFSNQFQLYHTNAVLSIGYVFLLHEFLKRPLLFTPFTVRNRHEITCTSCLSIFPMSASENLVVARYDFGFLPCPRKNILRNLYILFRDSS